MRLRCLRNICLTPEWERKKEDNGRKIGMACVGVLGRRNFVGILVPMGKSEI